MLTAKQRSDKEAYLKGLEESINGKLQEIRDAHAAKAKLNMISGLQSDISARRRIIQRLKRELER